MNIGATLVNIKSDWKAYNDVGLETRLDAFHYMRFLVPQNAKDLASPETISTCFAIR
jgi:hypothetical protein